MRPVPFTRFSTLRDKFSNGQRAYCKVAYDGLEPAELTGAERERALVVWGEVETVPAAARSVVVQVKGRDVGGTRLGAERGVHLGETANLDRSGRDELVYFAFAGPKIRHARVGLRFARIAARANNLRVENETRDGFTLIRHDGRRVRFECFAASRGGDTVRGVPIIGALLDEAAFFYDETTGVANGEHVFGALVPRLLPGGQILIVSSPWAESGLLYNEFSRNFGSPTTALAAHCPTSVMRDDAETLAMIERERARSPENARRELDAQFLSLGSNSLFDTTAIRACIDTERAPIIRADRSVCRAMCIDLAFTRNSSAACVSFIEPETNRLIVAEVVEIRPGAEALKPSEVMNAFAKVARRHSITTVIADPHYFESAKEHFARFNIDVAQLPPGAEGKELQYVAARNAIHEHRVSLPDDARLVQQMREVIVRPRPGGGLSISSPQKKDGSHGDVLSACVGSLWVLEAARLQPPRRRTDDRLLEAMFGGTLTFD